MWHPDRIPPFRALLADLQRYLQPHWSRARKVRTLLGTEGPWISLVYRSGSWIYIDSPKALTPILKLIWKPASLLVAGLFDVHISPQCTIGPGLYLGHHGGVWINHRAKIGANCNIAQGVVIGVAGPRQHKAPVLGDRVWVGPHAVITGRVKVGSDAVIGANSLVLENVPPKALVLGVPARVISYSGSGRLIRLHTAPPTEQPGEVIEYPDESNESTGA